MQRWLITLMLFLTLGAGIFAEPQRVYACSCVAGITPEDAYEMADAVFIGRVVDIDDSRDFLSTWGDRRHRRVDFHVTERWKGVNSNLMTVATGFGGGDCGYNFEQGKQYIVYAHNGEFYGTQLQTGICSNTTPLDSADDALASLGSGNTVFSDEETEYAFGSFPVREGLLSWNGWERILWSIFVILLLPIEMLRRVTDTVLWSGSLSGAFALIALYITPIVLVLFLLSRRWKKK